MATQSYLKKLEKHQIDNLTSHLKQLEKEQKSPKISRRKDIKIRPWSFPGKNTGVGCHFLLPGNLPELGIEPASLRLAGGFLYHCTTWEAQGESRAGLF